MVHSVYNTSSHGLNQHVLRQLKESFLVKKTKKNKLHFNSNEDSFHVFADGMLKKKTTNTTRPEMNCKSISTFPLRLALLLQILLFTDQISHTKQSVVALLDGNRGNETQPNHFIMEVSILSDQVVLTQHRHQACMKTRRQHAQGEHANSAQRTLSLSTTKLILIKSFTYPKCPFWRLTEKFVQNNHVFCSCSKIRTPRKCKTSDFSVHRCAATVKKKETSRGESKSSRTFHMWFQLC